MPRFDLRRAGPALGWTATGLLSWFAYQLTVQHGHALLRIELMELELEELTARVPEVPEETIGLPPAHVITDFELPDLAGRGHTLWQRGGRPILLIFFDPRCRFSRRMLPDLARLEPYPTDGRPLPIVVSTGEAEENRALMERHGVTCTVLLQQEREVADVYQAPGTPMGYLIDARALTVGGLVVGGEGLLALAEPDRESALGGQLRPREGYTLWTRRGPDLHRGLRAGAGAPDFRLPRVGGGELSLRDYRGQCLLLVFSDPACAPCEPLMRELETLQPRLEGRQILMVSRGDADANRAMVERLGLSFPVGLQARWEVSRAYRLLAAPVGFLVDEQGILASGAALGAPAILALLAGPERPGRLPGGPGPSAPA